MGSKNAGRFQNVVTRMKLLLLTNFILFLTIFAEAKSPENPDRYVCLDKTKPVHLTQTKDRLVVGICGVKDEGEPNHYADFKVEVLSGLKKYRREVFSDSSMNKKFFVQEKRDGLLLIEKVKVDQEYVDLFRHDLVCARKSCHMKKEICVILNKVKQKWILENVKDLQIKSRIKKAGC